MPNMDTTAAQSPPVDVVSPNDNTAAAHPLPAEINTSEPTTSGTTGVKRKRSNTTQSHQCLGTCLSGLRCKYPVADPNLMYCGQHRQFEGEELTTRQCSGTFGFDGDCSNIVTVIKETGDAKPALCNTHRAQKDCKFVKCYGKNEDGTTCLKFLRMLRAPYYCREHKDQADQQVDAIRTISDGVMFMVMSYLRPHERVTFALVNQGCANVVRSWGANDVSLSTTKKEAVILSPRPGFQYVLIGEANLAVAQVRPRIFVQRTISRETALKKHSFSDEKLIPVMACDGCNSKKTFHHFFTPIFGAPLTNLHLFSDFECSSIVHEMRFRPWLYTKAQHQCILCKTTSKKLNRSSVCNKCNKTREIWMRWCEHCNGKPGVLNISRAWWAAQAKSDSTQAETHSVSSVS